MRPSSPSWALPSQSRQWWMRESRRDQTPKALVFRLKIHQLCPLGLATRTPDRAVAARAIPSPLRPATNDNTSHGCKSLPGRRSTALTHRCRPSAPRTDPTIPAVPSPTNQAGQKSRNRDAHLTASTKIRPITISSSGRIAFNPRDLVGRVPFVSIRVTTQADLELLSCLGVLAMVPPMESQETPQWFSHDSDCPRCQSLRGPALASRGLLRIPKGSSTVSIPEMNRYPVRPHWTWVHAEPARSQDEDQQL